ncbi:MAG: serine/threonine-protein kinase [Verrucomicrobiales bacterium]
MAKRSDKELLNTCPECKEILKVSSYRPYEKILCPHCKEAIRVRTHFDHFSIEKELGAGGMSRVFKARDSMLGRSVALKILHPEFTTNKDWTAHFEREARLTASISHPNVVKVYSVGSDQGFYYIAMEIVEGSSLEDSIRVAGKMDEARVLELGIQVTQGLRAAHAAGLIHRDIKPGNLLLTGGDMAKIVDFGLALVADRDVDRSKVIWATPFYVPPEKLNDEPEDFRSDIYSLGATLFHALAGHPPFDADASSFEALKALKEKPVSLHSAAPDVSVATFALVDRMLARRPGDRQTDYDSLLAELNRARSLLGQARRDRDISTSHSQWKLAAIAVFFFGVAGFLVLSSMHERHDDADWQAFSMESNVNADDRGSGSLKARHFIEAREMLTSGDFATAGKLFAKLGRDRSVMQPTRNWALFNAGLCGLLEGDRDLARTFFRDLAVLSEDPETAGKGESVVFFQEVSRHMERELPVMAGKPNLEKSDGIEAMAWLAYGLKNWQDGRFAEAQIHFDAFRRAAPPMHLEWIDAYQPLLDAFEHDAGLLAKIPRVRRSMKLEEVEGALKTFAGLEGEFRTAGSARFLFENRRARAETMQKDLFDESKGIEIERMQALKREVAAAHEQERAAVAELISDIQSHGPEEEFSEALERLEALEVEDTEARGLLEDEKYAWRTASRFREDLFTDLRTRGYTGEIGRVGAPPLVGSIVGVDDAEVRLKLEFGESSLPLENLSTSGLFVIAEAIIDGFEDSGAANERRAALALYAWLTNRNELGEEIGRELASQDERFARIWSRFLERAREGE